MFLAKEEIKLRALTRDPVARLLFLNALFVIVSYALARATGGVSLGVVSTFKNIFIFISLSYLIFTNRIINPGRIFDSGFTPLLFGLLAFYVSLNSANLANSINRLSTFFVPFIYVYLSLSYLIANYGIRLILNGFHYSLLIIYCIPLLSYIITGGNIRETNIYGPGGEAQIFTSNHYGWSATVYILSYLFVWQDIQLKKIAKFFFALILPLAIILFFTSANRASWLSMSICMIPFFVSYKAIHLKYKIAGIIVFLGLISVLLADPNSSLNFAKEKNQKQEQFGEERFRVAGIIYDYFNSEPTLWITGTGMFDFNFIKGKSNLGSYHNSYYDVLFGVGIPIFLVFLSFMVFTPISRFTKYYYKYTLLLPPLMIIPFFESDLTGGQFLFFPWFTFMLLMNAKIKFWNRETLSIQHKKVAATTAVS